MKDIRLLFSEYGIILVLLGLIVFFSLLTVQEQNITGAAAGEKLAREVQQIRSDGTILLVASAGLTDQELVPAFKEHIGEGYTLEVVQQDPVAARKKMDEFLQQGRNIDVIATSNRASRWLLFQDFSLHYSSLIQTQLVTVKAQTGSNFLKRENLLNVADQIAVIAIMAIGMTMVIITGGIDLSVGSLVALAAVVSTKIIQAYMGGSEASAMDLFIAGTAAVILCASIGWLSGALTTFFKIPSFIVTLSMMLIASGLAYTISKGLSIYQLPDNFIWLGRGRFIGIPVSVWLMFALYFVANVVMTRMVFGRYVYAIGGNYEASRLSGVPIDKIIMAVFTICGLLAGVGGVLLASQLNSGSPTYGLTYELYVIAAVVIGGTSLMGGEGKIWGTLIGAFIIGVIQNGMNLIGIESYTQKVILGLLILGALLLEQVRKGR